MGRPVTARKCQGCKRRVNKLALSRSDDGRLVCRDCLGIPSDERRRTVARVEPRP